MNEAVLDIGVAVIKPMLVVLGDAPIQDKAIAAMKEARQFWMTTNTDEQFLIAVGALMTHYGEGSAEYENLKLELADIRKVGAMLTAMQAGVAVDLTAMLAELQGEPTFEKIGLVKLWDSTKE